ncbi:ABC transporter substrate-binding protein [Actinotalea sp. Marseille-Q4924]|uniref:ABC transporter substrate-binding protein n=1 Tax=Actinotalea sp. Marseille-Q4924 TaxID=2866571 RepID=UPI001CE4A864|nr:ABC transporter substrate-binding protein [Actinotalea sp. Marseille-Q4924]
MSKNMMRNRKVMLIAPIAAGGLLLGACGGGDADGGAAAGSGDEQVELTMYYPIAVGGPLTGVVDELIATCTEEHPNISVEAVYSGSYADTMTKAQTAARSGEGADLAVLLSTELFTLKDQNLIVPLNEISDDLGWVEDRFYDAFLQGGIDADGTIWSVPFQRSTIVQYHNKDLFAQAGLDPEAPPATWEELEAMSKAIVESGAAEYGIEIPSTQFGYWMLQALATQAGSEVTDGTGTQTQFDDPAVVEAMEYWLSLQQQGLMPPGTTEWASTPEDFLQGRTAMMWTTTGNLTNVRQNAGFDFGVSELPAHERPGSPTGGGNIYIFQQADEAQREAALTLAECLTSPENTAAWSIETGYVATGPEAWETEAMTEYVAEFPEAAVARDQLENAVVELSTHENGRVVQLVNDAIASVLTGQVEPEAAMTELQDQVDQILEPYRG